MDILHWAGAYLQLLLKAIVKIQDSQPRLNEDTEPELNQFLECGASLRILANKNDACKWLKNYQQSNAAVWLH